MSNIINEKLILKLIKLITTGKVDYIQAKNKLHKTYSDNFRVIEAAVKFNGLNLAAVQKNKLNRMLVHLAVKQNGLAIQFAKNFMND